jgi:hypothetical protein
MKPLLRSSVLAAMICAPAPSASQDSQQYPRLPESVQRVEQDTGGKVLQVQPIQRGDREVYRMKVLTPDGRIRVIQDDPRHPRESVRNADEAAPRARNPDDEGERR